MDLLDLDKWLAIGEKLGAGTLYGFFVLVMVAVGGGYTLRKLLAKDGILPALVKRLEAFLDKLEARADKADQRQADQQATCEQHAKAMAPGGACNVADLRQAAVPVLDALDEIGQAAGADVSRHIERAKGILSGPPPAFPQR